MATLVYSPGVRIHIATASYGVLDVTDDLVRGSVSMTENDMGSLQITLGNHRRKYDGVFTPNDRISVQMKRIAWVQVFSGYLNEVPKFSIYPRAVSLAASCTLKRLQNTLWDPGSGAAYSLLSTKSSSTATDGGVREKVEALLTTVAGWPSDHVHIGALPNLWYAKAQKIADAMAASVTINVNEVGGGTLSIPSRTTIPGGPAYTGSLPASSGKISSFGGPNGGAYGAMELSGEPGASPNDPWYCAMRWPYKTAANVAVGTSAQTAAARNWWKGRKILVVDQATGKAVVLRAADWGPSSWTGRVLDISPAAMSALGAKTDDTVSVAFANDDAALGPVTTSTKASPRNPVLDVVQPAPSTTLPSAASISFAPANGLKGNVAAARSFIQKVWPKLTFTSGYRSPATNASVGGAKTSDHLLGLALDFAHGGGITPNAAQAALATSLAAWMVQNPNVFGVKQVIWDNKYIFGNGQGWRPYTGTEHRNHVHISFKDTGATSLGATGGAWAGSDMPGFSSYTIPDAAGASGALINASQWVYGGPDPLSEELTGVRALMNDTPLLQSVRELTTASMRSFMSAPNGDFIAWFPDYFGQYGTAGVMNIQDIELSGDGFTVQWSDEYLKTHIFATGPTTGFSAQVSGGGSVSLADMLSTSGVASVEFPEIMDALFNISGNAASEALFHDAQTIFDRFGARVESASSSVLYSTNSGSQAEFWYALSVFQRSWAQQFSSQVSLTFMPEVFPGMLLRLPSYGFQAYVTAVSHSFDFDSGFTTTATIIAPSASDGSGLFGLGKAG